MPSLPLKKDCCACAACVDTCPKGAISFYEDSACYYQIKVDQDKCIECKLCEKHCHILHPEILKKSNPLSVQPLAAWSINEELIKHSASGGIFAQIAYNFLQEENVFIYGAALQEDNTVKHMEIADADRLKLLQNSKYQQSVCVGIYKQVKNRLKEGSKVLFSGLPCQVAALYAYLGYKDLLKNLYTIEVLCHGVPCNDIHRTSLKVNKATRIYAYRNKDGRGWCGKNGNNNRLSYIDLNGKRFITQSFQKDSLFRSYLTFNFTRENCYHCPYSEIHRVADLTLGDFWGWNKTPDPRKYENYWGTSIVLPNTEKGRWMMQGHGLKSVETVWREFLPINQNLYMPSNGYDYKGCKLMPVVRNLPVCMRNVIYQNGFFNQKLDKIFSLVTRIIFRNKRRKANDEKVRKSKDILNYLEREK